MFLLSCLLLVPMILATKIEFQILTNYVIGIDTENGDTLKSIEAIGNLSEELNLSGSGLRITDANALKNVSYIKSLNLSNNTYVVIRKNMFTNFTNLEKLDLSHCNIFVFKMGYIGLRNLKVLDLSYNQITYLRESEFIGLSKSCVIWLKGNHIYTMSTKLFDNESRTVASSKGNYTDLKSHAHSLPGKPKNIIKICKNGTKLISVEHYTEGEKLASGCSEDEFYADGILNLSEKHITEFQKGWYKLGDLSIYCIDLNSNNITRLTSNILNDLPESISSVDFSFNRIERLEKGIIVNEHLRKMNFKSNYMTNIEDDVLINTNLRTLTLSVNRLTDTKFAATLPPTLTEIFLESNRITEISRESFKRLTALEVLHLTLNLISELELGTFADLKNIKIISIDQNHLQNVTRNPSINLPDSLQVLDLHSNSLTNLKAGTFVNSPKYELLLYNNYISNIENGTFNLPHLHNLELSRNSLSVIDSGELQGLKNLRNLSVGVQQNRDNQGRYF